jgi:hypothetical protein
MRVKETYNWFSDEGRFSYFIIFGKDGVDMDIDDLTAQASAFNTIILVGEIFEQKEDAPKLVNKIRKKNPDCTIDIITSGLIRPIGMGIHKVNYTVIVKLKNSGLAYYERIENDSMIWFNEAGSKFKFYIETVKDLEEIESIIKNYGIKKGQVYIGFDGDTDKSQLMTLLQYATDYKYNFFIDWGYMFWPRGVLDD